MIGHKVGIWNVYNGQRFKEPYDLELKDGTILKTMYPNADSWSYRGHNSTMHILVRSKYEDGEFSILDSQIAKVRLLTDSDIQKRCPNWFTGINRKQRTIDFFGEDIGNFKEV